MPILDGDDLARPVPEFLDAEQQDLYRRAHKLYNGLWQCGTSGLEYIDPTTPLGGPPPPTAAVGGYTYTASVSRRYRDWDTFINMVKSVFTDEFWTERNRWDAEHNMYIEHNGYLYYLEANRGSGDYNSNFPDEFVLLDQTEKRISFLLIGHYSSFYPRDGESFEERDARLIMEYDYTWEFPMTMVLTEYGWRFSEFYTADGDDFRVKP